MLALCSPTADACWGWVKGLSGMVCLGSESRVLGCSGSDHGISVGIGETTAQTREQKPITLKPPPAFNQLGSFGV